MVTQDEAAKSLGQPVAAGVLGTVTVEGGLNCVFFGPHAPVPRNPNGAPEDSVRVTVVHGQKALTWYKNYKSKAYFVRVYGYGSQAYYNFISLSIMKGDYYLRVAVSPAIGTAGSLPEEKQLAAFILPGLSGLPAQMRYSSS